MDNAYQVMPDLTKEEYERLKEDIWRNGLAIPIDTDEQGNILDGYNRKKICDELGVRCEKTVHPGLTEEEKYDFALRVNMIRRHLTREQVADTVIRFRKAHPELSDRAVARETGVSKDTVRNATLKNTTDSNKTSNKCPTGEFSQLDSTAACNKFKGSEIGRPQKTTGIDGKNRPASAEKAEEQRKNIQSEIEEHPEKSDREIARETGVSPSTVGTQRKKMRSFHDLSARDEKALRDPDIVRRLTENENLNIAGAIREQKREQLVEHLENVEMKEARAAEGAYDVIVIDPPWPVGEIRADVRAGFVGRKYPVMSLDEIKALKIPAAENCHLFLWTTQKFLPDAFDVLKAWGAKYVCTFVWDKGHDGFLPFGLPRYNCEFCLYAHIGSPEFIDQKAFYCCFGAPTTGNSEKPEAFYGILRRVTAGRRLDMFNRRPIEGFDGWGKEAPEEEEGS